MEHLYFKKKVAQMRKDLLRQESALDAGRFTFSKTRACLKRLKGGCCFIIED